MLYGLEQGPFEKKIIEQCAKDGLPLPKKIAAAPELKIELQLFYQGFLDLNSCRVYGGGLPWSALDQYCARYDITGEQREDFFYYLGELDKAYLKYFGD